jgi:hypothetical protein
MPAFLDVCADRTGAIGGQKEELPKEELNVSEWHSETFSRQIWRQPLSRISGGKGPSVCRRVG